MDTPKSKMKLTPYRTRWALTAGLGLAMLSVIPSVDARNFRVSMMPNGSVNRCANCHVNPGGGGARNAFGLQVEALVTPGGREEFWSAALAAMDADGDGAPNGLELGDPDGDGTPIAGRAVTHPSDENDTPPGYHQTFDGFANGTTDLDDGSVMGSTTNVTSIQDEQLRLTDASEGSTSASFKAPITGIEGAESISIRFDLTLIEEEGGNPPADGFSINLGTIDLDPDLHASEEGFMSGLAVEMDTWDNGAGAEEEEFGIGVDVSVDGVTADNGRARIAPDEDRNNNTYFKFDGVARPVDIIWTRTGDGGLVSVLIDEEFVFEDLPVSGYEPSADDVIAFGGRTGGATETVLFDNLSVNIPALPIQFSDPRISVDAGASVAAIEVGMSSDLSIPISNLGASQDLVISEAVISGIHVDNFEILTSTPLTIAPGATENIMVRVTAGEEIGALSAMLVLTNNDAVNRRQSRTVNLSASVIPASVGTAIYAQDFNSFSNGETDLADGSILFSSQDVAEVVDQQFQLTQQGVGNTVSWYKTPSLGEQATNGWIATFDLTLIGSGRPADGFSFNFGPISDDGNPAGAAEEGFGEGLAVEFDTWDNGGEGFDNGIGIDLSVDGFSEEAWQLREEADADPVDNMFFKFDGVPRPVVIEYTQTGESEGTITVIYGGETFFDNVTLTDFTPETDYRFAFAGRTGGATETVLIDNLVIIAPPQNVSVYSQKFEGFDNGTTDLDDGSEVLGATDGVAGVQDGALRLTQDTVTSDRAVYKLPSLGEAAVNGFTSTFDFSLFETAGGNPPADGFSFNYGAIPEGIPEGAVEEGVGNGLAIEFDTWDNNNDMEEGEFGIGIDVSVDGTTLDGGRLRVPAGADRNNNDLFQFDGSFHQVSVIWRREGDGGLVSVILDGEPIFNELPTGDFSPAPTDQIAFAARTGGATETVLLDNVYAIGPNIPVRAGRDPQIEAPRNFGVAAESGQSATDTLTILNKGFSQELTISEANLTGAGAGAFEILTALPVTIPVGATAAIEMRYNSTKDPGETDTATLTLVNNDSSPQARQRVVNLVGVTVVPGGGYSQNFDAFADETTELGDHSIIHSNGDFPVVRGGQLLMSEEGAGSLNANFKIPPLGKGGTEAFIATFEYSLEHSGGQNPADGFSFNYGSISNTLNGSEEGYGSGLAVEFDTWDNAGNREGFNTDIGIDVSVDGTTLEGGATRIEDGADLFNNDLFQFDGSVHQVEVLWFRTGDADGILTVNIDGEPLYEELPTPDFDPQADYRFAFAARTGGATETLRIDNVTIVTGNEDPNLLTPAGFNAGLVTPGAVSTLEVPIRNTGQEMPLSITGVTVTSSPSGVFTLGTFPDMLAPRSSGVITVALNSALAQGLATGELTVTSNDPSQPSITVPLAVSVPLSADLIAWYPMDETDGTNLLDNSGNGRNGTYSGPVTLGQAALAAGTSVQFEASDGTSSVAAVASIPALQTLTLSLWAQATGAGNENALTLFTKSGADDAAYSLALFPNFGNQLGWIVQENADTLAVAAENGLSEPTHLAIVHEDSNGEEPGADVIRLYVNGEQVAVAEDSPDGFVDADGAFQIGARDGDSGFDGLIDDLQIYSRALTAVEVKELFDNPGTVIGGGLPPTMPTDRPVITSVVRADGDFSLSFQGDDGKTYAIEYSEDLETWVPIETGLQGVIDFSDTDAARLGRGAGYYRGVEE